MNKGERPDKLQARLGAIRTAVNDGTLAIAALSFFADDRTRAERFFAWSGLEPGTIRAAASQPGFGAGILQFLIQDESLLVSFAEQAGYLPAELSAVGEASLGRHSGAAD